jgi:hypothetical protein
LKGDILLQNRWAKTENAFFDSFRLYIMVVTMVYKAKAGEGDTETFLANMIFLFPSCDHATAPSP